VSNGPPTFQRAFSTNFREYLDLLDDFTIYNDMENHLMKLRLWFQKCREYKISLKLEKCAFMVFFKTNFRVHSFQGRKDTKP